MSHRITVLSLGPGSRELITLGALSEMRAAKKLVLRTGKCDAAKYLSQENITYDTLDALHEECEDFDELAGRACQTLLSMAETDDVVYAVLDAGADDTVEALINAGADITLTPGVPLSAPFLSAARVTGPVRIAPATSLSPTSTQGTLLITELNSKMLAGDCKLKLLSFYAPEQPVLFFPPSASTVRSYVTLPLEDLDRQPHYDHTCGALILPLKLTEKTQYDFQDLIQVMRILRGEDGCPWDKEQTHASLRPYLIEEAYETAAAIDEEDWAHVADELGDVLLQVVFQADIGAQYGTLELGEITTDICRKMIFRHRHIFGSAHCDTAEDVVKSWESIKKEQRGFTTQTQVLKDVSKGLPSLMRAEKVQKKASMVGFDWACAKDALEKVREETQEVLEALDEKDDPEKRHLTEELGDLLFSCVNVARLAGVESETCLLFAVEKFISRFENMENIVFRDGKVLKDLTNKEMDVYWEGIKKNPYTTEG